MDLKKYRGRHFLTLLDYTESEIRELIDLAIKMKKGKVKKSLKGKSLALLFEKPSTRTRVSFEVGMTRLGGHALYVDLRTTQLGRGESIADTARTFSRYVDGVMARLYKHTTIEEFAKYSTVPVINGLTDMFHPCQTMADMQTVFEHKGDVEGLKVVFLGDCGFNMFHSTMIGFSKLGADVYGICPNKPEYMPKNEVFEKAKKQAKGKIVIGHDISLVEGADVVITDTWVSMGQENEQQRLEDLKPYQVNLELMKKAKEDAIFMHCLPAHRGHEVVDDVIDGKWSVVFDEAENRLHAQNAILVALLGGK